MHIGTLDEIIFDMTVAINPTRDTSEISRDIRHISDIRDISDTKNISDIRGISDIRDISDG